MSAQPRAAATGSSTPGGAGRPVSVRELRAWIKTHIPEALAILGSFFLLISLILILGASSVGSSTTTTTTFPAMAATKSRPSKPARTVVSVHPGSGSDTIDVAVLSLGLLLMLSAAFYGRISEIDFPGGVALKLSPEQAAVLKAKAAAVAPHDLPRQRRLVADAIVSYANDSADEQQRGLDEAFTQAVARIPPS